MLRITYYISFALILLNLLPNLIEAQVIQYGNEWYSPNQDYIKLIGDSEGIYRVTANDLVPFGIPINIPPKKLHLIFQGREQPIWVQDQNGNNLPPILKWIGRRHAFRQCANGFLGLDKQTKEFPSLLLGW
jgi:hypothetical protein